MKKACAHITLIFIALTLAAADALAVEVTELYTAEAPLERNDMQGRNAAYTRALSRVLTRITGLGDPFQSEEIAALFPDPSRYVMQYRPGEDESLLVTFDGKAIERLLRQTDVAVWGSDRPLTLVWLAVDRGQGEREIVAAGETDGVNGETAAMADNRLLRERVLDAATERGLPMAFPLLDAEDLQQVTFSDIWGGFDDPLLQASRRYAASSVLVGRIGPGAPAANRWSWYFGGERRTWTGDPEGVIGQLAGALAAQFAASGDDRLNTFGLTVSGIDSVAAFGAVQSYLERLDVVEDLSIDTVGSDRIRYRVSAHGGKERLRRVLELSRSLEPVETPVGSGGDAGFDTLAFRYRR